MTATLVLGGPCSGKSRHAAALLARHPRVTVVSTRPAPAQEHDDGAPARSPEQHPAEWRTLETLDLTQALLASRHPVLIDDLSGWLQGLLDEDALADDPQRARAFVEDRLDELSVALRAMPFEVVTVSQDTSWVQVPQDPRERLTLELISHVNQRVSAACPHVYAVIGGRVLDLSRAPLLGSV
ncbi:bifunctional adenosylcobinamide kinase/adenosylcobinamide-phosphate guanylyltransferase [Ornithinimicrobium pekingense]|uniref:Adenosylcobinamide kinase n=1 Tax=Ornithinimicrobium pekingense TaxID=384677 RepID=A0ABQ2F8I6_9MICO|nr:bifunctional adenosylcobinamide kinase/adenosylcobinamide-phosphate guanylyltransferase [Ornithinimicrobium pekingense]GGK69151.1 adenosylcobinamide kinase/adenosylcobinamide phosphate guanyltransferase [Ornithinimicrobium pekingense]